MTAVCDVVREEEGSETRASNLVLSWVRKEGKKNQKDGSRLKGRQTKGGG